MIDCKIQIHYSRKKIVMIYPISRIETKGFQFINSNKKNLK
jgi:hypothetical protein